MELLTTLWLGMPVWIRFSFIAIVLAILAFDLGVMNREAHEIGVRESLSVTAGLLAGGKKTAWEDPALSARRDIPC